MNGISMNEMNIRNINVPPALWQEGIQWKALTWYLNFNEWAPSYRRKIEALIVLIKTPYFLCDSMHTLSLEQLRILHKSYNGYIEIIGPRTEDDIHEIAYILLGKTGDLEDEILGRLLRQKFKEKRRREILKEAPKYLIPDLCNVIVEFVQL